MNHYSKINNYLTYLMQYEGLQFCIKDFCGFIPINKELDEALQPFLAHTNPFCMYIKKDRQRYYRCLTQIRLMYNKIEKVGKGFFGICHAGLGEYVVPISYDNTILGTLNVGFFYHDDKRAEFLVRRTCSKSELLDADVALDLFRKHIVYSQAEINELIARMELIAEYLGNTYHAIESTHSGHNPENLRSNSNVDTIIAHAIEYIRQQYMSKIKIEDIADFCHCSESYLSRIFKKRTGVNINVYINKMRVEVSKNYLLLSSDSVSEIAMNLGFSDPNYFSRVFASLIGHPPTEFRRRFKTDAKISEPSQKEMIKGAVKINL